MNSKLVIIVGEEEVKNNFVTVKNNKTKEEMKVRLEDLLYYLDESLSEHQCDCNDCHCDHEH